MSRFKPGDVVKYVNEFSEEFEEWMILNYLRKTSTTKNIYNGNKIIKTYEIQHWYQSFSFKYGIIQNIGLRKKSCFKIPTSELFKD